MASPTYCPPIPESLIQESFIQSSGPGGQNVNKVATAVQIRFHAAAWWQLTPAAYTRLAVLAGRKLNPEGYLTLTARTHRTQAANRADARTRLHALLAEALRPPPPPRRATKPTKSSQQKRLTSKATTGQRKQTRKKVAPHGGDDD